MNTTAMQHCHFQSIYRLKKACHGELDEDCILLTPDQVVDRIFELVDENGDGKCLRQLKILQKCFKRSKAGLRTGVFSIQV